MDRKRLTNWSVVCALFLALLAPGVYAQSILGADVSLDREYVIPPSLDESIDRWERMGHHTFAPDGSELIDSCAAEAAEDPTDQHVLADCFQFARMIEDQECTKTWLPDGRNLDLLADRDPSGKPIAKRDREKAVGGPSLVLVCDLGPRENMQLLKLVFVDGDECFNTATIFAQRAQPESVSEMGEASGFLEPRRERRELPYLCVDPQTQRALDRRR